MRLNHFVMYSCIQQSAHSPYLPTELCIDACCKPVVLDVMMTLSLWEKYFFFFLHWHIPTPFACTTSHLRNWFLAPLVGLLPRTWFYFLFLQDAATFVNYTGWRFHFCLIQAHYMLRYGADICSCLPYLGLYTLKNKVLSLQWRHNGRDGVSNHQPHDCLLNRLFGRRSKSASNSGADDCISEKNRSNHYTSNRFGTHTGVTLPENNPGQAKFQYRRHFSRWPPWAILKSSFFARKWQQMVEKDHFDKQYVLSIYNVQLEL